jgi:TolB-like protein
MKSKKSILKIIHIFAGMLIMTSIFATPVLAEFQRTKIAVLDFASIGEKLEPESIGTILSEWFITSIVKSGRFDVVERAMLQKIVAEQKLSTTGLVDESTASQLGKLLGVEVIITGSILKLRNSIDINARIINVQSGSIIAAENISTDTDKDYHDLVKQLTAKIMQNFPLTGYIVKKDNKIATIDLGMISGLAVGTEFVVYKEGEIIKHPKTGEVLDVEKIQTGQIRITKVDSNVAIGDILSEVGEGIQYGQMVKSVQASPQPPVAGPSVAPAQLRKERNKKVVATVPPPADIRNAAPVSAPAPVLAAPGAPPQQPAKEKTAYNLLRNGDFEAGLGFWGKGQYGDKGVWWTSGNCRSNAFARKGSGRDGNAALYIDNPTPRGPNVFGTTVQQIVIQPGKEYRISLYAKGKGLASGGAINISVDPAWTIRPIHLPAGSFDWRKFEGTFKLPSSTAEFRIISEDVGEAWIDDIGVTEAGRALP